MRSWLSVRSAAAGGYVLPWVRNPPPMVGGQTSLTILVHGYNNTELAAGRAYSQFLANVPLEASGKAGQVCEFYWPGDVTPAVLSAASYPVQIGRAIESGRVLQAHLARTFGGLPIDVTFIAHSLGCRVVLELLLAAVERPVFRRLTLCLMAAAVPVELLFAAARLRVAARRATYAKVLFSHVDEALGWAFTTGQAFAGERTLEAVGRRGGPAWIWSQTANMTPYAHGDYWRRDESATEVKTLVGIPARPYRLPRAPLRYVTRYLPLPPLRQLPRRRSPA